MSKSMWMTVVGAAVVWCSGFSAVEAQGYLPPTPYTQPHPSMPAYSSPYQGAPYHPDPMSGPAVSGGYISGGNPPQGYTATGAGPAAGVGPFWAPGGYEARIGSPYLYHDPNGGQFVNTGNPYYDHYGPGFHRHQIYGHYRFPYYNYRAPWYYPGRAVYNRDTNLHW